MDKKITHQNIERLHSLVKWKPEQNKSRRNIIKFSRYHVRAKIFETKENWKENGIAIRKA